MVTLSHRMRVMLLATLLALLAMILLTKQTHAAWSADPVEVHATPNFCPLVAVASDAAFGAYVMWQELTPSGQILRAHHLLASGDLDPAWAAPVQLSTAAAPRMGLGSVSDGAGGAYVWWMEGTQLYLTRLAAEGAVATGWPARGRQLGTLHNASARPVACSDGGDGIYIAWLTTAGVMPTWIAIRAHHLGPANTAKAGWPMSGRTLGGTQDLSETVSSFGIAAASDGGLWLSYGSTLQAEADIFTPGSLRVARYDGAGLPVPGWVSEGVTVEPFSGDLLAANVQWGLTPALRLTAVAEDGAGGAFVLSGLPFQLDEFTVAVDYRLHRVDAAGALDPSWPAGGRPASVPGFSAVGSVSSDYSLRLHGDGAGHVFAGRPMFFNHGSAYAFDLYSEQGLPLGESAGAGERGIESEPRGDGGLVVGSYFPHGPNGFFQPNAFVQVSQSDPGGSFYEWHDEPFQQWYGDIGLAATGDGGSIFAWSQNNERFGIYAVRMNPDGQVLGVPPLPRPAALHVRFERGRGVQVSGAAGRVRLTLHDLGGREVARGEGESSGEWTVPGTAGLASGMYFARTLADGSAQNWKVLVLR